MQPEVILSFFARYIESELGIVYADHNYFQLQNRLEEIAKLLSVPDLEQLHQLAKSGIQGTFKQLLLDIATNNETSFFRDAKIFRAVENLIYSSAGDSAVKASHLNIWSAASSSGQEALSLAMLFNEANLKTGKNISFKITGTDISERILAKAQAAKYSQLEVQRGLPAALMIKYFKKDEADAWVASSELMKHIEYKKLNLKETFRFREPFDLVFCRNVLIYQNVDRKIDILGRIRETLTENGLLILGSGESLIGLSDGFSQVNCEGAVVYGKKTAVKKAA